MQGKVSELSRDIIAPRRVLGCCWGIVVQKPQDTPCPGSGRRAGRRSSASSGATAHNKEGGERADGDLCVFRLVVWLGKCKPLGSGCSACPGSWCSGPRRHLRSDIEERHVKQGGEQAHWLSCASRDAQRRKRRTRKVIGHGVMLRVVLQLLGADGGTEKVHQVLEDVLLAWGKRARLRVRVELVGHGCDAATSR